MQVSIDEAKSRFAQLSEAVERGEEVVIARRDKPVARLVAEKPEMPDQPKRRLGFLAGTISEDVIRRLTDPALDLEIENDFMESLEDDFRGHCSRIPTRCFGSHTLRRC